MKQIIYIPLIIFMLSGVSCTENQECRKNTNVKMKVGFYKKTLNESTSTYTTSSLSIDSITVQGLGKDSILYNNTKNISAIDLPLNKFANESKFVVTFNQTKDTLTIEHKNTDYYLSMECGCIKAHSIDTVLTTNHFIDSVTISNHNVNTNYAEHIQLYN